jgi:hypothetical protein
VPIDVKWEVIWAAVSAVCAAIATWQAWGTGRQSWEANRHAGEANAIAIETAKKGVELDRRMVAIEEARDIAAELDSRRARVTASLIESNGMMMVRLENRGQSSAINVRVEACGRPLAEVEWKIADGPPRSWPLELDPSAMACIYLQPLTHCLDLSPVVVTWDDGTGERGRWTSDLA